MEQLRTFLVSGKLEGKLIRFSNIKGQSTVYLEEKWEDRIIVGQSVND